MLSSSLTKRYQNLSHSEELYGTDWLNVVITGTVSLTLASLSKHETISLYIP